MSLIVQKYGGTSVGDVDRIKNVAQRVKETYDAGHQVVVVVSARSGVTNELIGRAKALNPDPDEREIMLEDRRRIMIDADAKRDAQRRMAWFSLTGMLLFPFGVVFTEWMELPRASDMLSSMSNIYYVSIAAIVAAYYGFTNMGSKE